MGSPTTADSPLRARAGAALAWAAGYALVVVILRLVVRGVFGPGGAGPLLALPCHLIEGLVLALPLFMLRRGAAVVLPVLFAILFVTAVLLHYEALLGELPPGSVVMGYLGQLGHVASSISSGAKVAWFAAEVLVSWSALAALYFLLAGRAGSLDARPVPWVAGAILAACLAWTVTVHVRPDILGPRARWSARLPLAILVTGGPRGARNPEALPGTGELRELQGLMGLEPFASGRPGAPLCAGAARAARRPPGGRSVILVVLESVGMREMEARVDGRWLLPELRRISKEAFSAGRMVAVGTQTCQALPAYLAGQPAQPWDVLLWRDPLPRFQGLPAALGAAGYRTAYFHGAGLSFEKKRQFLRMVGVEVLHELHSDDPEPRYGWGLSDEVMFARTRAWIEEHGREEGSPYLMIFAALSGHHPYKLPASWPRRFAGSTDGERFLETLAYEDAQLGRFYDWYVAEERQRGTYLVITSDHAPLHFNTLAIASGRPLRFDIPFLVAGPDPEEIRSWRPFSTRLSSQLDVPATLGGLVGVHPGPCDQGLDLLGEAWPARRIVAGAGGRGLDELYLWDGGAEARFLRSTGALEVLERSGDADAEEHGAALERFLSLFLPVTRNLIEADAYAPAP